jgi:tetratricopeptide (TPR) repeat protein
MKCKGFGLWSALFAFLGFLAPQAASAIDASVYATPLLSIPIGTNPDGASYEAYTVGGGFAVTADLSFFDVLTPYVEAGYMIAPGNKISENLKLLSGGAGLAFSFYPLQRLSLRAGGGGGMYHYTFGESYSGNSLYLSGKVEAGYRFSPTFTLLGSLGYARYLNESGSNYSGLLAGVSAKIGLASISRKNDGLAIEEEQKTDVFPIRYYAYEKDGFGSIALTNKEKGEIRDVKVYVAAGSYGAREAFCGTIPSLRRNATAELPLYAALNDSVLAFTESTKVQAEVIVRYKLLDTPMEAKQAVAFRFNHRNAMTWSDPRMAAAFVSPNDAAMLELSKYLAGLVRERIRPEIDKNLQYGMGAFEGIRLTGVTWAPDPSTPYKVFRNAKDRLDYIQYPYQTLAYKSGDSDDISVLLAEALESVGIPSGFVPLKDEMLVAFPLSANEATAKATLGAAIDLIYKDGQAWLPLESSLVREGFLRAWQGGSKKWKDAVAAGESPELIVVSEAWKGFSPVGLPAVEFKPSKPAEEQVARAFENILGRFVQGEVAPKVQKIMAEAGGQLSAKQMNNLGILYARYGLLAEAVAQFQKAADTGFSPAYTNLANVAFLQKDYETAAKWFEAALKATPNSKAAIIGLARARYELDAYAEADDLFGKAKAMDPALAERYAYLSSKVDASVGRASSAAADRGGSMTWSDNEE